MNASLTYGGYLTSGINRRELCLILKEVDTTVLCLRYFLRVGTLRALHSECIPLHSFTSNLEEEFLYFELRILNAPQSRTSTPIFM